MITSYITLLPNDNPHANAVEIGITIKLILVRDKVIELDVVAIKTKVSNDLNIVVNVLYFFLLLFRFVIFIFEICNHFFNVTDMVIKTVNIM